MARPALAKYQIGLFILAVFALAMTGFLVVQANAAKTDAKTYKSAEKTANAINEYISTRSIIPASLKDANITYDAKTVSYKKDSATTYTFCVTYKANGNSLDGTNLIGDTLYGSGYSGSSYEDDDYKAESIYLDYTWKKGENCQTVEPYIVEKQYNDSLLDNSGGSGSGASNSQYYDELAKCDQLVSDEEYYACIKKADASYYQTQ